MRVHTLCVGMLQTNCHIVFDPDHGIAACIDPGGNAEEILAFLKEHNLTLQDIYLTHISESTFPFISLTKKLSFSYIT